jgi:hypothetical protein
MIDFKGKLRSEISFSPDDGAFRSKLIEVALDNMDEDCLESFSEDICDIIVKLSPYTVEHAKFRFTMISDLGELSFETAFSKLNDDETSDLKKQVSQLLGNQPFSVTKTDKKVIVRKKLMNGMLDSIQASNKLGCSIKLLKKAIPCTDYSYSEVNGIKTIEEYYWSQSLIERLCQMKLSGVTEDDVNYIAEECCNGEIAWANDILFSIGASKLKQSPKNKVADVQPKQETNAATKGVSNQNPSRYRPKR